MLIPKKSLLSKSKKSQRISICCFKFNSFHRMSKIIVYLLKVQICKSYNNKYIIALKQIANTEILETIVVLVFKLLSRKLLFTDRKKILETHFFTAKLLQNYKWLKCKTFRIILKRLSNHLSVLFQFSGLYL